MYSNKRTKSNPHAYDDESDALVPASPTSPAFEQTTPESVSSIIQLFGSIFHWL